jgi:hypothetical protein
VAVEAAGEGRATASSTNTDRVTNMHTVSRIGWFLALGCLVAAGVLYVRDLPAGPQPPFEVTPTEVALADVEPGTHEVVIRFRNTGTVARRIIGLQEG